MPDFEHISAPDPCPFYAPIRIPSQCPSVRQALEWHIRSSAKQLKSARLTHKQTKNKQAKQIKRTKQTNKQTNERTNEQTDRQTDSQTFRQTHGLEIRTSRNTQTPANYRKRHAKRGKRPQRKQQYAKRLKRPCKTPGESEHLGIPCIGISRNMLITWRACACVCLCVQSCARNLFSKDGIVTSGVARQNASTTHQPSSNRRNQPLEC